MEFFMEVPPASWLKALAAQLQHFQWIDTKKYPVGIEINANHISSPTDGYVYAKATPVHIGGSTSVWNIDITNDDGKRVAFSRFTAMHKNHPETK